MYNVNDIADYVIIRLLRDEDNKSLINLKLQKLLYFIQAWYCGIKKTALFDGEFQAWVHGPVCIDIYNRFKDSKTLYSFITIEDILNDTFDITESDRNFIDWILENYAGFSGIELEKLTHKERPWIKARGLSLPNERCTNIISIDSLIEYYGERWDKIENK